MSRVQRQKRTSFKPGYKMIRNVMRHKKHGVRSKVTSQKADLRKSTCGQTRVPVHLAVFVCVC